MARLKEVLLLLAVLVPVCVKSRPMGGKFSDVIYSNGSDPKVNGSCHLIGMYNGSTISVKGSLRKEDAKKVDLTLVVKVFKLHCANFLQQTDILCSQAASLETEVFLKGKVELIAGIVQPISFTRKEQKFELHPDTAKYKTVNGPLVLTPVPTEAPPEDNNQPEDQGSDASTNPDNSTNSDDTNTDNIAPSANTTNQDASTKTPAKSTKTPTKSTKTTAKSTKTPAKSTKNEGKKHTKRDTGSEEQEDTSSESKGSEEQEDTSESKTKDKNVMAKLKAITIGRWLDPSKKVKNVKEEGVYLIQVYVARDGGSKKVIVAEVHTEVHNPTGYLSAVDYPALVFYGLMTSLYAIFGVAWIILMLCSFSDLVRLQFWVLAVIILGFLEKTFFVGEYSAINLGSDSSYGAYFFAEGVSAVKRGISRMLLIIVAMGFGTVKPRLGDSLIKVVGVGVAFIVLAFIDGIMRARSETFHTSDTSSVVTLALLLLLDTFIFYWIFTAIVDTRRTLRLRKNYVKLAMYNHFAYTLMFAIVATLGFLVWVFVDLEYPSGMCLTDWKEVWLRDCFWHVLFAFILVVVMVIWRPSSNRSRFAYSLVTDVDDDEVLYEQGGNKNFDTVKMRSVSKSDAPPPVASQAEDDLRWVEENLPTTALDKALPLLVDSDEEVMTTKFEMSKMN